MKEIITAEGFLNEHRNIQSDFDYETTQMMIKFARLHTKAALKKANKEALKFVDENEEECYKPQILNCYPKELIK